MSTISDRFKKLYAELDELRELVSGSSVTELEGKVSEAELEFIRVEVVPYLAKIAGEKLASLRCDVDLTLKYRQGKGMEYSFAVSSTGGMKRGEGNTIAPPNDVKQTHDKAAPIKETLVKETPKKENPAKDIPVKEISIKQIPVKATPAKATPVETSGKLCVSRPERRLKEEVVRPQMSTHVSEKRPRVKVDNAVPKKEIVREAPPKSDVSEISSEEVVMRRQPRRIEDVKMSRKFVSKSEMCQLWIEELMEMECEQKGCYMAPHKAIFLLTILYLIQGKKLRMNKIFFDQTLWGCYRMLWEKYVPEDWGFEPDVVDAYTSLNGELYYRLVASIPKNADLVRVKKDWTHISVTALVAYSEIDDELFSILCIDKYCDSVRDAIVDKYITKQTRRYERMFIEDVLDDVEEIDEEEEDDDDDLEDYWIPADFEEYLASVKSPNGLPYSEEWVARKLSLIKDEYMQSMLEKHFDASHVDDLESIGEIDKLISKVRWGVIMWQVDEEFVIALRLYREYRLMRQDA